VPNLSGIKKGDGAESCCTCQPSPPDDACYSRTIGERARARKPIAASHHAPDIGGAFGMGLEPLGGGEDGGSARAAEDAEIGLNCSAKRDEHVAAEDLFDC